MVVSAVEGEEGDAGGDEGQGEGERGLPRDEGPDGDDGEGEGAQGVPRAAESSAGDEAKHRPPTLVAAFDDALVLALDDAPVRDNPSKSAWYLRTCFGTDGPVPGSFKQPSADVPDGANALSTPYRVRVSFRVDAVACELAVGKPVRVAAERRWSVGGGFGAPARGVSQWFGAQAHGAGTSGKTLRTGLDARTIAARTATKCFADVAVGGGEERGEDTRGAGETSRLGDVTQHFSLAGGVEVRVQRADESGRCGRCGRCGWLRAGLEGSCM